MVEAPDSLRDIPRAIIGNMTTLAASGFGLVVALAWNELIQRFVREYLDPLLGKDGSMVSLLLYAVVITVLAVIVTMQLSMIQRKLEKKK